MSLVLIRVKLKGKLPVGLFYIVIRCSPGNVQSLIVVFGLENVFNQKTLLRCALPPSKGQFIRNKRKSAEHANSQHFRQPEFLMSLCLIPPSLQVYLTLFHVTALLVHAVSAAWEVSPQDQELLSTDEHELKGHSISLPLSEKLSHEPAIREQRSGTWHPGFFSQSPSPLLATQPLISPC